jgi:hypothetical protein
MTAAIFNGGRFSFCISPQCGWPNSSKDWGCSESSAIGKTGYQNRWNTGGFVNNITIG